MIEAFTQDLVARITGLSRRQLEYWDQLGVVHPSIATHEWRMPRLYSFRDLMKLKVATEMRKRKMLPSQIKHMMGELEGLGFDDPLLTVRFVGDPEEKVARLVGDDEAQALGNRVYYIDPRTGPMSARQVGQKAQVFDLTVRDLRSGLEATIDQLTRRPTGQITKVRQVQGSAPVVAGTRVPTSTIAQMRDEGWGVHRTIAALPSLTAKDVRAALDYEDARAKRRTA